MEKHENSVYQALLVAIDSDHIVDKHIGKAGLDMEEGRFRVAGTLTLGKIHKRKQVGTNIALSAGYIIEDLTTGHTLFVEKQQGVKLSAVYGMRNAFISFRSQEKRDANGVLLQTTSSTYLQPYPQRSESFTQDDRIRTAFKLDNAGNLIHPFQLNVAEEECTEELWRIVQRDFVKGSKLRKRAKRVVEEQHHVKLASIRQALKTHGNLTIEE